MPTEDETFLRLKRKSLSQVRQEIFMTNMRLDDKFIAFDKTGYTREEYFNYCYNANEFTISHAGSKEEYIQNLTDFYSKNYPPITK